MIGRSGGRKISNDREDIAGRSTVLLMLSDGLEIEHSNLNADNVTLKGDPLKQEVQIVIGGIPNILEVHDMSLVMSLGKIPFEVTIMTNLFDLIRY
jgi:hypothetical protein